MVRRKRWRITYRGTRDVDRFASKYATYQFVQALARTYAADPRASRYLTVWVDEGQGHGWERFEDIDLEELA